MLQTINKSLLLSLLAYSFVFPIRQIARVALARTLNQAAPFRSSLAVRCPFLAVEAMMQTAQETTEMIAAAMVKTAQETTKIVSMAMDADGSTNSNENEKNQNRIADNQVQTDLSKGDEIRNSQFYVDNHPEPVTTNWQPSSSADTIHDRFSNSIDVNEQQKCLSGIIQRAKLEQVAQTRFINTKSEFFSSFSSFASTVQDKISSRINSYCLLSRNEAIAHKNALAITLCELKNKLSSLNRENPHTYFVEDLTKNGFNSQSIFNPYRNQDRLTTKDLHDMSMALNLKAEIELISAAIEECDRIIHRFEQETRDFENKLETSSSDQIEQQILPSLLAEKESTTISATEKEYELNYQNNKLESINNQLELLSKKSWWEKLTDIMKRDPSRDSFVVQQSSAKVEQKELKQQLQGLQDKQNKQNTQIERIQKITDQKKQVELEQAQLAKEKQEQQEARIFQEQLLKERHQACNFDAADCPSLDLAMQWCERQKELSKTIEQGYKQHDQDFHLSSQTVGFLAAHDLNYTDYQRFFGTALQHQIHREMCDALSQAATLQVQFPYQNNFITSVADFADAAYEANKSNQILLASQLMDVDWIALRLSRDIATAALPYAQGVVYGIAYGATDVLHMASRPIETCKDLGKTICFALETAALNCVEDESMAPESYKLKRDQRNEEVAQALHKLGDQMANSTGPQRVEALARFGTNLVLPGKVIHAVGEVSGVIRSQAKIMRTLEGVAPALSEELGFETSVQELTKTVQKIEHAAQDSIAQAIAKNLKTAEKQVVKSVKSLMHESCEPVRTNKHGIIQERSFVEKKISALEKAQNPKVKGGELPNGKIRELPDGRTRYYAKEDPSKTVGPTRGRSHVTEFDPKTNHVRQWEECYDHSGNVNRIHPKMIDGKSIDSFHYPLTKQDLEIITQLIKGKKQ